MPLFHGSPSDDQSTALGSYSSALLPPAPATAPPSATAAGSSSSSLLPPAPSSLSSPAAGAYSSALAAPATTAAGAATAAGAYSSALAAPAATSSTATPLATSGPPPLLSLATGLGAPEQPYRTASNALAPRARFGDLAIEPVGGRTFYPQNPERFNIDFVNHRDRPGQTMLGQHGRLMNTADAGRGAAAGSSPGHHIFAMTEEGQFRSADSWQMLKQLNPVLSEPRPDDAPPLTMDEIPNRFHHSSLVEGNDVGAAGEMAVNDGRLERITDVSGHYMRTQSSSVSFLRQAVGELDRQRVPLEGAEAFSKGMHGGDGMRMGALELLGYGLDDDDIAPRMEALHANKDAVMRQLVATRGASGASTTGAGAPGASAAAAAAAATVSPQRPAGDGAHAGARD